MRIGSSSVHHQGLTAEAAAIVKAAVSLAKRRGHAQVTPLHVASATMADPTGLLKAACLRSHSHPLQCKALELCFNVALNRLPTGSSSSPLFLGSNHRQNHHPSFSNALVAAFKRAQSHQRRGSIENQQQPILALKIELEQLVISILDDPSVSRVMREAGFSSPQVKNNVEQAVSLELCSSRVVKTEPKETIKPLFQSSDQACEDDVNAVLDSLMGSTKKRNTVVVGENLGNAESIMRGVIAKLDRGDVRFVSVPLWSLRNMSIEEVQQRIGELRCLVNGYEARWVVLYLGDLKWVSEFWSNYGEQSRNYYSPVEFMIMELSRLLCGFGDRSGGKKLCLMGIANLQTFMRCKSGHPSLETLWQLHPLTVPVIGNLGLSLNLHHDHTSDIQSKELRNDSNWLIMKMGEEKRLKCCSDCRENFKREAWSIEISNACHNNESTTTSTCSSLPSWLKSYQDDQNKRITTINSDKDFDKLKDLSKKWNSICRSVHKQPHFLESPLIFSSSSPNSSSSSVSSHHENDQSKKRLHETISTWPLIFGPKPENKLLQKPDLLSNPNSSPNSASCSEANDNDDEDEDDDDRPRSFKEFNSENVKALSKALGKKVPWHKDIIPEISTTLLQIRSGMVKRNNGQKEESWFSFLGVDQKGKETIAKELARLVFGSYNNFVKIGTLITGFPTTIADSSDEYNKKKRMRIDEPGSSYLERFAKVVKENPSCVFFMEDLEQVDYNSQVGIKKAIESGRITVSDGGFVPLKDAIVIFSCDSFSSLSRACSPAIGESEVKCDEGEIGVCGPLDLNIVGDEEHDDQLVISSINGLIMDSIDRQIIFKIQVL
ncbi:protein SMAX1-LIKE 3-like [Impatiens glandulifera]|uniref:protein SMAX1-LIKE 3-like n=1 Tax=Impatiens glandulifera TaxID=253017 RepID=UPI001FB17B22|nr:protein SMAX1-LIKE 3-like [Impatiens glandulifera]